MAGAIFNAYRFKPTVLRPVLATGGIVSSRRGRSLPEKAPSLASYHDVADRSYADHQGEISRDLPNNDTLAALQVPKEIQRLLINDLCSGHLTQVVLIVETERNDIVA